MLTSYRRKVCNPGIKEKKKGGRVIFRGVQHGKIIRVGWIKNLLLKRFFYVNDLKHNLLSISQFCDNRHDYMFHKHQCIVNNNDETRLFTVIDQEIFTKLI